MKGDFQNAYQYSADNSYAPADALREDGAASGGFGRVAAKAARPAAAHSWRHRRLEAASAARVARFGPSDLRSRGRSG